MKKEYSSPSSVVLEMVEENGILAMSQIPIEGETDHFDSSKKDFTERDESQNYWED